MDRWARAWLTVMGISLALFVTPPAEAHCDTMGGPVVADAKVALEKKDVTPALKWVNVKDEREIRELFTKTLKVRAHGSEARELADRYFFETLVRVHRAGEGAPYTGLKAAEAAEPGIAAADAAITAGLSEKLIAGATSEMAAGIHRRFQRVTLARRHADDSVEAGREYVAAYVDFVHYVEGLHRAVAGGAPEHVEAGTPAHHEH
jgi:Family of unknown function (DUF6448)